MNLPQRSNIRHSTVKRVGTSFTSVRSDLPKLGEKSRKLILSAEVERTLVSLLVSEVTISADQSVGCRGLQLGGELVEIDCQTYSGHTGLM